MGGFRNREIVELRRVWCDAENRPWLLTLEVAVVNGRTECVGMSMRSYLALPVPDDSKGIYGALAWVPGTAAIGEIESDDWALAAAEGQEVRREMLLREPYALNFPQPRPLRTKILRQLKLGTELEYALRFERSFVEQLEAAMAAYAAADPASEAAKELEAKFRGEAEMLGSHKGKPGRRKTYGLADLEKVAAVYRQAHDGGSRSPTKQVSEDLKIPYSTAAKRVAECRRIGLLFPTEKAKAGGTRPPADETDSTSSDDLNEVSDREEQP